MSPDVNFRYAKFQEHYFNMCEFVNDLPRLNDLLKNFNSREDRHLVLANIPVKYWDFKLEKIFADLKAQKSTRSEPLIIIQNYINSFDTMLSKGLGLYIEGTTGTSKTTISIIILREAIKQRYRAFFCTSGELIDFVTMGWRDELFKKRWQYIVDTVDFLVIDDIARQVTLDTKERNFLDKLFVNRSNLKLPTILTSNVMKHKTDGVFSHSLYSLFKEMLCTIKLARTDVRDDYEKINRDIILNGLKND
jgi:DNA replication protein DnaC